MSFVQVRNGHYDFDRYVSKHRWASYWHQLDEVIRLKPTSVLEIGTGIGIFKKMAINFGLSVKSVDIDPDLQPDYLASVLELPFKDNSFDLLACFQMLEHLPYDKHLIAMKEIVRVSTRYVVISLPDAKKIWRYSFHIPKLGEKNIYMRRPSPKNVDFKYDGEHYWEVNSKGYPLARIVSDHEKVGLRLMKTYRVPEHTYHRFFVSEILK